MMKTDSFFLNSLRRLVVDWAEDKRNLNEKLLC